MKKLLMRQVKGITIDSIITVSCAHEFTNGYWNRYTQHKYRVEYFTRYQIVARNIEHDREMITIRRKDLDDCFFMIIDVTNTASNNNYYQK